MYMYICVTIYLYMCEKVCICVKSCPAAREQKHRTSDYSHIRHDGSEFVARIIGSVASEAQTVQDDALNVDEWAEATRKIAGLLAYGLHRFAFPAKSKYH